MGRNSSGVGSYSDVLHNCNKVMQETLLKYSQLLIELLFISVISADPYMCSK